MQQLFESWVIPDLKWYITTDSGLKTQLLKVCLLHIRQRLVYEGHEAGHAWLLAAAAAGCIADLESTKTTLDWLCTVCLELSCSTLLVCLLWCSKFLT